MMNSPQTPPSMTSIAPYMLRAVHQWIIDNGQTPCLLVNALLENVEVPRSFVQPDGHIILNSSPVSTEFLNFGDEYMSFKARFRGRSEDILLPIHAIMLVFARETGAGLSLEPFHKPPAPVQTSEEPATASLIAAAASQPVAASPAPASAPSSSTAGKRPRPDWMTVIK